MKSSIAFLLTTALYHGPTLAVLPPGYEDEMWCPPGYCDRTVLLGDGFAGPASVFHECYNEELDVAVDEIWTGSLTDATPPADWITTPELVLCDTETRTREVGNCAAATDLIIGTPVSGSTYGAAIVDGDCGSDADDGGVGSWYTTSRGPAVWFKVEGTGHQLSATTCGDHIEDDAVVGFDTQISVFTGGCGSSSLECLVGNDDHFGCGLQSRTFWPSQSGVTYYILVHGFGGAAGDFSVLVEELYDPQNSDCTAALPLTLGTSQLSTTNFFSEGSTSVCNEAIETEARGAWYAITGTGNQFFADFCSLGFPNAMQVSIFSGSCASPQCEAVSYDSCSIEWTTSNGVDYFILVQEFSDFSYEFSMTVREKIPPSHGLCDGAIRLTAGTTVVGSTSDSFPGDIEVCGVASASDSPGVFYSFMHAGGGGAVEVSTCESSSFDTQLLVFSGSCGSLQCVGGSDDSCNYGSHVRWNAESGINYFIYVHGFALDHGDFSLTIREVSAPSNDVCAGAIPATIGSPLAVETEFALADSEASALCDINFFYGAEGPGVWFRIEGADLPLRASVCDTSTDNSTAQVAVYSGSCDSLECVGNPGSCSTAWDSVSGTTYYILVQSESVFDSFFPELIINEAPDNDFCAGAYNVNLGATTEGSTEFAAAGDYNSYCGESDPSYGGAGVWYQIDGTGSAFRVSTCDDTFCNNQISIFSGECNNLVCVNGNYQSAVSWTTEPGVTYYILVSSHGTEVGSFSLEVEEVTPPANDICSAATPIAVGSEVLGSTMLATGEDTNMPTCDEAFNTQSPGVWFSVEGTDATLVASTCGSTFDTQISVFSGSCDSTATMICEAGNDDGGCDDGSLASWFAESGQTYFILVHGHRSAGEYALFVDEVAVPTNSQCQNAEPLSLDTEASGSTVFAEAGSTLELCFDGPPSPGLWFSVSGTGRTMVARTCGLTTMDTIISVFSGDCNGGLECRRYNDDNCGLQSVATWDSDPGTTYYILVTGYGGSIGDFGIVVSSP